MSKLEELVPPLELCKLIPKGEFDDCAFIWDKTTSVGFWDGEDKDGNHIGGFGKIPHKKYRLRQNYSEHCRQHIKDQGIELDIFPAPTLEEILEELRKNQEDVFLKWSETAYNAWLINAYTHDKEDYQDHNSSAVTAALTVWLKVKGIDVQNSAEIEQ